MGSNFNVNQPLMDGPLRKFLTIDPSANTDFDPKDKPRAVFVGGAGNLVIAHTHAAADEVTLIIGASDLGFLPVSPARIADGTTATGIVACW